MDVPRPRLLSPDNFTPRARTPWGGRRIAAHYKAGLGVAPDALIGESWEVSVEPDFPSRIAGESRSLAELVAASPEAWLGREGATRFGGVPLLVKLLDAAEPLSVQIHPSDDHPAIASDECGKPESWYVVDRAPGAGLYLGLDEHATPERMRAALADGGDVSSLLTFVAVEPGDFFVIPPGTPHAIGAGLTLVEPQRVLPGKRGITYRYWDWNRRYDASGQPSATGSPRTLHVDEALAVTRWDAPRGGDVCAALRTRTPPIDRDGPVRRDVFVDPHRRPAFPWLAVERLSGTGALDWDGEERFRGLTVLDGAVRLPEFDLEVPRGRSLAIPASAARMRVELDGAHAIAASVPSSEVGAR